MNVIWKYTCSCVGLHYGAHITPYTLLINSNSILLRILDQSWENREFSFKGRRLILSRRKFTAKHSIFPTCDTVYRKFDMIIKDCALCEIYLIIGHEYAWWKVFRIFLLRFLKSVVFKCEICFSKQFSAFWNYSPNFTVSLWLQRTKLSFHFCKLWAGFNSFQPLSRGSSQRRWGRWAVWKRILFPLHDSHCFTVEVQTHRDVDSQGFARPSTPLFSPVCGAAKQKPILIHRQKNRTVEKGEKTGRISGLKFTSCLLLFIGRCLIVLYYKQCNAIHWRQVREYTLNNTESFFSPRKSGLWGVKMFEVPCSFSPHVLKWENLFLLFPEFFRRTKFRDSTASGFYFFKEK